MAGTVTVTQAVHRVQLPGRVSAGAHGQEVVKTSLAWTSSSGGAVSGNTLAMPMGTIAVVEFIPGSGGTQPTNLYDVTFLDPEGINMFDDGNGTSIGADLSNSAGSHRVPFIFGDAGVTYVRAWLHGGSGYDLVVAAAGDSKTGTVNIFQVMDVV